MRRRSILVAGACTLGVLLPTAVDAREPFPDVIALPDGFRPEGIAIGRGASFYAGSLGSGAVVRGDLRTGELDLLVDSAGGPAVGIEVDAKNRVWVAGGPSAEVRVYDGTSGEQLALYQGGPGFLNDLVVTIDAVYVTNSFAPVLTVIPLGPGGALPDPAAVGSLPLVDFPATTGFGANGIEAWPDGRLVVAHSAEQALYAVDPDSGQAAPIEVGQTLPNADGITRRGDTLYVVQNRLNQIAVVRLDPSLASGTVVDTITNPAFDVPTTVAVSGNDLYVVNARFGIPDPGTASYAVVGTPRR